LQNVLQLRWTIELHPTWQLARGIDIEVPFLRAPGPDGVKVLEGETQRVHLGMASRTGWVGAVLLHALAERPLERHLLVLLQFGHIRWRRWGRRAQELLQHPATPLDRRGAGR